MGEVPSLATSAGVDYVGRPAEYEEQRRILLEADRNQIASIIDRFAD
jgi:hypothetical protein